MKILAIKLRAIGDTVIWTSALQSLRDHFPSAEIHTLTYAGNSAVLRDHPAVSREYYLEGKGNAELVQKLWSLRRERFTWLSGFHATTSLCRWAWLAGAQKMALHHHSWSNSPRGSVNIPHAGQLEDAIARDHRVLEAMGVSGPPAPTRIWIAEEESNRAEAKFPSQASSSSKPRFAFLPGAGHHLRRVPKEMWLPLAARMAREGNYQPVVIVDEPLSRELNLAEECRKIGVPLLNNGSLREFMALISRCEKALANDSGPGHIAVALGVRTTFAFGPGCVGDWHPYDKVKHPVLRVRVECRAQGPRDLEQFQFCTVNECSHHSCMRQLKLELNY